MNDASDGERTLVPWDDIAEDEKTRLLVEHQRWLDGQPPTCSLIVKTDRFIRWLAERGIAFDPDFASKRPARR
ncbi:MAG TPA: hypothetical protein PLG99_04925 [Kaistiaceae bacterium]|mgnify:FL=1|nr:hypothetical protein [Kaistiaceae bacterium]